MQFPLQLNSKYNLNTENISLPENGILQNIDTEMFQYKNELFQYI